MGESSWKRRIWPFWGFPTRFSAFPLVLKLDQGWGLHQRKDLLSPYRFPLVSSTHPLFSRFLFKCFRLKRIFWHRPLLTALWPASPDSTAHSFDHFSPFSSDFTLFSWKNLNHSSWKTPKISHTWGSAPCRKRQLSHRAYHWSAQDHWSSTPAAWSRSGWTSTAALTR